MFRFSNVTNISERNKQKSSCETVQLLKDLKDDPMCACQSNHTVFFKDPVVILNDVNSTKERENIRCLNRSKQLFIVNEKGCMRGIEVNREMVPKEASNIFEYKSTFEPSEKNEPTDCSFIYNGVDDHASFSKNSPHNFSPNFSYMQIPSYNNGAISSDMDSREELNLSLIPQSYPHYTVKRTLHKKTYTGKKRGRKPKSQGLKKQTMSKIYSTNNNSGDKQTIPCTLLENHSFTQVSVEEVHLAADNGVSRPRRNIQKKSASEMLMLKRKKIVQSTIEYQSSKFNKTHTVKMDTKFSDNRYTKQKKNAKANTENNLVKKNAKTNIERSLVKKSAKANTERNCVKKNTKANTERSFVKKNTKANTERSFVKKNTKANTERSFVKKNTKANTEKSFVKKNAKTNTERSLVKKSEKGNTERSLVKRNIQNSSRVLEKYGPELLPPGWTQQLVKRKTGKSAGVIDIYFVTPEGKRLRSRVEVAAYIEQNNLPYLPEEFCFKKSAYKMLHNSII